MHWLLFTHFRNAAIETFRKSLTQNLHAFRLTIRDILSVGLLIYIHLCDDANQFQCTKFHQKSVSFSFIHPFNSTHMHHSFTTCLINVTVSAHCYIRLIADFRHIFDVSTSGRNAKMHSLNLIGYFIEHRFWHWTAFFDSCPYFDSNWEMNRILFT